MTQRTSEQPSPLRLIVLTLLAIGAVVLAVVVFKILLVLFAGILFAVSLHASSAWLQRHLHLPYGACLALLLVVGIGLLVLGIVWFAPTVVGQLATLGREVPQLINQAVQRVQQFTHGAGATNGGQNAAKLSPNTWVDTVVSALGNSLEVLGGLVVIYFLGVYGAAQPGLYRRVTLGLTPAAKRRRVEQTIDATAHNLARWLLGRLVAMLFVGITSTIAFKILNLPLALALGLLAGLLTFVEYAGAVISAIPPILLGLSQSTTTALAVAGLFTGLHLIEGYVLTPLLARASVRLPPGCTLASQVLLGALVGPLGLTFSTPLLVVIVSAVQTWQRSDERQRDAHKSSATARAT